ncbi:hypothetical protein DFH06DRAFT_1462606 [Mycena polygramma]|nr:hypothetical protein DFH06DRAFT_1462606 [Mycena polygramma]
MTLSEQPHIVIIGAGVGGMMMAIELKRIGFHHFTVIEKASEVGGTWRDNIYPGCSSDVPVHIYSLSTDLKPDWIHTHAFQPEIQAYLLQLALKHDLYSNIIFNRKVLSAQWDTRSHKYDIVTEGRDGTLIPLTAQILVSATGILEVPRFPDIPGISRFHGNSFHSARWDNSVSLAGKRVAVVGSGASATQYVPIISKDPSVNVTQFCRSPGWILPPVRKDYSALQIWLLEHVPFYLRAFRIFTFFMNELLYLLVFASKPLNLYAERQVRAYMLRNVPMEYADKLIPSRPNDKVGCKRVIYDTDYLSSLARPNMSLVWDPIESITEDGILTKEGTLPFDVIIYSTGYIADHYPVHVKGVDQTVSEYYQAQGGPTAYLGTTLPGFPNFFTIFGANTATGYTSVIFAEEVQVQYILQMIKPIIAGHILSMEVTAEATDKYNRKIQSRLSGFCWSKCFSWYRTGNTGKVHGVFPGSMILFWWWMRRPDWTHYKVLAVGQWEPRRSVYPKVGALLLGCLGMGLAGMAYLGRL